MFPVLTAHPIRQVEAQWGTQTHGIVIYQIYKADKYINIKLSHIPESDRVGPFFEVSKTWV